MELKDLSPEQREKIIGCKSPEEILKIASEEGYDLSDAELEQINGGWSDLTSPPPKCPKCGSSRLTLSGSDNEYWYCYDCGYKWLHG